MQFLVKLVVSNLIIVTCVQVGRRFPTLGGLIATMPLTSLIVLLWLYSEEPESSQLLASYTRGVLWGIVPTVLFFLAAYFCFRRGMAFPLTITIASAIWVLGAVCHSVWVR